MAKKRYAPEEVARVLAEIDTAETIAAVCRKYGVSKATIYRWRKQEASPAEPALTAPQGRQLEGAATGDLNSMQTKLRELEAENDRLKEIVASQLVEIDILQDALRDEGTW